MLYLLACVFSLTFSKVAGGLNPMVFSANTLNENSDFPFKLLMVYVKLFTSSVTILLHLVVETRFSIT